MIQLFVQDFQHRYFVMEQVEVQPTHIRGWKMAYLLVLIIQFLFLLLFLCWRRLVRGPIEPESHQSSEIECASEAHQEEMRRLPEAAAVVCADREPAMRCERMIWMAECDNCWMVHGPSYGDERDHETETETEIEIETDY